MTERNPHGINITRGYVCVSADTKNILGQAFVLVHSCLDIYNLLTQTLICCCPLSGHMSTDELTPKGRDRGTV